MPRRRRPPRPGALADLSPVRILTQIVVLQAAYYATAVILIVFTALAAGKQLTPALILDWHSLRGDITTGWMFGLVWMLNGLISVIFLLLLIARSKLVPDFAFTIHFLHLVATSVYTRSVPRYVFWWGLQFASASLMTSLGIWSCQWRELQPINFGGSGGRNKSSQATSGPVSGGANGIPAEEEVGFSRLKGKGRGLDGADVYELVSK